MDKLGYSILGSVIAAILLYIISVCYSLPPQINALKENITELKSQNSSLNNKLDALNDKYIQVMEAIFKRNGGNPSDVKQISTNLKLNYPEFLNEIISLPQGKAESYLMGKYKLDNPQIIRMFGNSPSSKKLPEKNQGGTQEQNRPLLQ